MKRKLIRYLFLISLLPIGWLAASYAASVYTTRPNTVDLPEAEKFFDFAVEKWRYEAKAGIQLNAWFLPATNRSNAVILLNGLRGNKSGMVKRAVLYHDAGYQVLMPDLRGTGESQEAVITFGWREQLDLQASIQELHNRGIDTLAAHGISLGAATIAYSLAENPAFEFLVLESCYDNIRQALKNRIEPYGLPPFLFQGIQIITEWRIGASAEKLAPEYYLSSNQTPTLFIAGEAEQKVKKEESERLYEACPAPIKALKLIPGAKHENFMNRYEAEMNTYLGDWLEQFQ